MPIYCRAHAASCFRHAGAVLPVVAGVAGLVFFSRLLADAAGFAPGAALKLLGFTLLQYAPQFLVAAAAAGSALALARAFAEREMDAWFALGVGLRHFVFPVLLFAAPAAALTGALALDGAPWAARAGDEYRAALARAVAPENLRPGVFGRVQGGGAYFITAVDGEIAGVFLTRRKGDRREVILSGGIRRAGDGGVRLESGRLYRLPVAAGKFYDEVPGDSYDEVVGNSDEELVGNSYEEVVGNSDEEFPPVERMAFEELEIVPPPSEADEPRARARRWADLRWASPADRAEMVWRINMPLSVLLLALCAPLLTRPRPQQGRMGRGHGFAAALLLFALHLNLLYFARDAVADESAAGWLGLVFPHLAAGGTALVLGLPALLRR